MFCADLSILVLGLSSEEEDIWLLIRTIRDPEHPYTLAQLRVVSPKFVKYEISLNTIIIQFEPTIPNCSLSSVIGLCIREKILRNYYSDPPYRLVVKLVEGSHENYESINKQLIDKERVAAALENPDVSRILRNCIDDVY